MSPAERGVMVRKAAGRLMIGGLARQSRAGRGRLVMARILIVPISVLVICWLPGGGVAGAGPRFDDFLNPPGEPLRKSRREFLARELLGRRAGDPDFVARHRSLLDIAMVGRAAVGDIVSFVDGPESTPLQRRVALLALGLLADRSSAVHLARWLDDSKTTLAEKISAAWSLGFYEDLPSEKPLRDLLDGSGNGLLRGVVVLSLARRGAIRAIPEILQLVDPTEEPDAHVRAASLLALGLLDDPSGEAAVIESLDETDRLVREAAIWALGAMSGEGARGRLLELAPPEPELRATWILAISRGEAPEAVKILEGAAREGLRGEDPEVRAGILYAAAHLGGKALDLVSKSLQDARSPSLVADALLAAAASDQPDRFAPAILTWLSSDDPEVLSAAALAAGSLAPSAALARSLLRLARSTVVPIDTRRDALLSLGNQKGWSPSISRDELPESGSPGLMLAVDRIWAVCRGRLDPAVLREAREERLVALRARFEYRFAAARDRLVRMALELDGDRQARTGSTELRSARRSGGSSAGGSSRGLVPEPPPSGDRAGAASRAGDSESHRTQPGSDGALKGSPPGPARPDDRRAGKTSDRPSVARGGRRAGVFHPELVEHDLRLLLDGGYWFPRD